jgi:hypothetical protein
MNDVMLSLRAQAASVSVPSSLRFTAKRMRWARRIRVMTCADAAG